jgi:hypothetical protein
MCSNVKRYDPVGSIQGDPIGRLGPPAMVVVKMVESPTGGYVAYDEYAKMASTLDDLLLAIEEES